MPNIIVNNIENASDKKKAFEIRDLVFCKEQKVSKKIEFDGLDEFCDHYLAKINELPIGTARIREEKKGTFKIERMAVLKEYRKKGVGKAIIEEILKHYFIIPEIHHNHFRFISENVHSKAFKKRSSFLLKITKKGKISIS